MNRTETAGVLELVQALWPHSHLGDNADTVLNAWHSLLRHYPAAQVRGVVEDIASGGDRFAPAPGMVASRCGPPIPSWIPREFPDANPRAVRMVAELLRLKGADPTPDAVRLYVAHPDRPPFEAFAGILQHESEAA